MLCKLTLEQICTMTESPLFDRKSARIDAKTLAIHLIAFANADGGVIAARRGGRRDDHRHRRLSGAYQRAAARAV